MSATKADAERDGIKVPTTLAEYCVTAAPKPSESSVDMADFYDDDYLDDEDDDDDDAVYEDDDDSGNGESWWLAQLASPSL